MIPGAVLLVSAMAFIYSFLPTGARMGEENVQAFLDVFNRTQKRRLATAQAGTVAFTLGVSMGMAEIFGQGWALSTYVAVVPPIIAGLLVLMRELRTRSVTKESESDPKTSGNGS
jgi:hypothetical protein